MEIDKEDRVAITIELSDYDIAVFKEMIINGGEENWTYVSETGEAVDIKFVSVN